MQCLFKSLNCSFFLVYVKVTDDVETGCDLVHTRKVPVSLISCEVIFSMAKAVFFKESEQ